MIEDKRFVAASDDRNDDGGGYEWLAASAAADKRNCSFEKTDGAAVVGIGGVGRKLWKRCCWDDDGEACEWTSWIVNEPLLELFVNKDC